MVPATKKKGRGLKPSKDEADDVRVICHASAFLIDDDFRDILEKRAALTRFQKMETLGLLAVSTIL